jgi:hypothetical protein
LVGTLNGDICTWKTDLLSNTVYALVINDSDKVGETAGVYGPLTMTTWAGDS